MEKKTLYVFTAEQVYDCEVIDLILVTFWNKNDAVDYMKKFVEDIKSSIKNRGWQVEEDCPTYYQTFEPFHYVENHVECIVHETEIR